MLLTLLGLLLPILFHAGLVPFLARTKDLGASDGGSDSHRHSLCHNLPIRKNLTGFRVNRFLVETLNLLILDQSVGAFPSYRRGLHIHAIAFRCIRGERRRGRWSQERSERLGRRVGFPGVLGHVALVGWSPRSRVSRSQRSHVSIRRESKRRCGAERRHRATSSIRYRSVGCTGVSSRSAAPTGSSSGNPSDGAFGWHVGW